jgi:hypothetical protein
MKQEFKTYEELEAFVNPKLAEEKYVMDIRQLPNGAGYSVQWQEHKTYTAFDGKVFPDEVWITEDDRMLLIQDIEPEHCRNILRMMLRQEREARAALDGLTERLLESLELVREELQEESENITSTSPSEGRMLH